MDMDKQMQLIKAGKFKENNGSVMRSVNIIRHQYHPLKDVKYALPYISEGELLDSINFLHEAGYIKLRSTLTKEPASLADFRFEDLEAKLTDKGIRLLAGGITDSCIVI